MKKKRIISEKESKRHSERRKAYNADKASVQMLKTTHEKLKKYCIDNDLVMKDFLDELILTNLNS